MVSDVVSHSHDDKVNNLPITTVRVRERPPEVLRIERPAKLIRTAIQEEDDDGDSEITVNDAKNCCTAIYRQHGKR